MEKMMARKSSEKRFREMAKSHNFWWVKYGDVRYCVHCGKALPKSELKPDFAVSPGLVTYVECKNSDSTGRWNWTEIGPEGARSNQRAWLQEHNGWLFIELGTGKAPNGVSAWLIPWLRWEKHIEPILGASGQSSIKMETEYNQDGGRTRGMLGGNELFEGYGLEWQTRVGWRIPRGHPWWRAMAAAAKHILEKAENMI
jgi:hypothetical protein